MYVTVYYMIDAQDAATLTLTLLIAAIVRTTNEEAAAWAENTAFRHDILNHPWIVSEHDEKRAKRKAEGLDHERKMRDKRKRRELPAHVEPKRVATAQDKSRREEDKRKREEVMKKQEKEKKQRDEGERRQEEERRRAAAEAEERGVREAQRIAEEEQAVKDEEAKRVNAETVKRERTKSRREEEKRLREQEYEKLMRQKNRIKQEPGS